MCCYLAVKFKKLRPGGGKMNYTLETIFDQPLKIFHLNSTKLHYYKLNFKSILSVGCITSNNGTLHQNQIITQF